MFLISSYRAEVANGNSSGQPAAANMMQLVWDDDLASAAQKLAEKQSKKSFIKTIYLFI
jgi:hypothetical protein